MAQVAIATYNYLTTIPNSLTYKYLIPLVNFHSNNLKFI